MAEGLHDINEGVNREFLRDLGFVDDRGMVAEIENGLQIITDKENEVQKYGVEVSVKMLKVMVISGQGGGVVNITLNGKKSRTSYKVLLFGFMDN